MLIIDKAAVDRSLRFPALITALREAFAAPVTAPRRSLFPLDGAGAHGAFGVQQAWTDEIIALKAFTHLPGNPAHGRDTVHASVLLFDRRTGEPLAVVEGTSITYWRTAAVSALAADYLARDDAETLLVCGTGRLAPHMALAHAAVRPIRRVIIWGRNSTRAARVAHTIAASRPELAYEVAADLEAAAHRADIISCATSARVPIMYGAWVRPGTHVDLVGNHEADARECDTALVLRSRVYVDTRVNVLHEAGELLIPIDQGFLSPEDVVGELAELAAGTVAGRAADSEITLFKSVGTALSDLAAARLVMQLQ